MTTDPEKLHIFEILARQHEPMLLAYVLSLMPEDRQLVEDTVQDTFLIAYRKIGKLRDPASFGAWLRGIARYEVFSALRKRSREVILEPEVLDGVEDVFAGLEQQRAAETWQERLQIVENCFRALPDKLMQVCQLHYFEDRKCGQVAAALHLEEAAVRKRLERARDAIRDCVQEHLAMEGI